MLSSLSLNEIKEIGAYGVILFIMVLISKFAYDYAKLLIKKRQQDESKQAYIDATEELRKDITAEMVNKLQQNLAPLLKTEKYEESVSYIIETIKNICETQRIKEALREVLNEQNTRTILIDVAKQEVAKIIRELQISDEKLNSILQKIDNNSIVVLSIQHDISKMPLPRIRELDN